MILQQSKIIQSRKQASIHLINPVHTEIPKKLQYFIRHLQLLCVSSDWLIAYG
jgi:hypothetical protein